MPPNVDADAVAAELAADQALSDVVDDLPAVVTLGAETLWIHVNDGAGGRAAAYELRQASSSVHLGHDPGEEKWRSYDTIPASMTDRALSWSDVPVPWAMRADVVNRSSAPATYRVRLTSVDAEP